MANVEYSYKAKDPRGAVKTGTISGSSKSFVKSQLIRMRLKPIYIRAAKAGGSAADGTFFGGLLYRDEKGKIQLKTGSSNPTTKDLIIFTKQFSTMLNSGVSLVQSLNILSQQQRVRGFGITLGRIKTAVENGASFSEALDAYPEVFDTLYVAMVRAGEASGNLDKILLKLVTYVEKAARIKSQVKSALTYPALVIVVAIGVVSGLLIFVVPMMTKQFTEAGKELPAITAFVVSLSNFVAHYFLHIVGGVVGFFLLVGQAIKTPKGRIKFDSLLLKLPGIGQLLKKIAVGRFCSTMSTMLTSGVNLLEALSICAASAGNKIIEAFVLGVRSKIEKGFKIHEPLSEGGLFPPMVVSMVAVGEETGALDEMLTKVAEFYEEEVDLAVKTMLAMIEPVMIVVMGSIVGFIVIAMYMPIFDMAGTVGG